QVGAPGQIDHRARQRLVQREVEAAGAGDALPITQGLVDGVPERDPGVLDGVVLVDLQIALAADLGVEGAVPGERVQHVIEEGDAGRDLRVTAAVQVDRDLDLGLLRLARNLPGPAHACASPVSASRRDSTRLVSPGAWM